MSHFITGDINNELGRRPEARLREARVTLAELEGELREVGFKCQDDRTAIFRDIGMTKAIIRDLNFQIWGVRAL